jgi:hypothetical protein
MGIRKSILTSGGFASAIGICLATLSAGTLVVFSVIAAGVGFDERSTAPSVARAARGGSPAAITFPSTGRTSAENQGSRTGNTSLLDVIGSAGSDLDENTTAAAAQTQGSTQTAARDGSGAADAGSDQVAGLVPDIGLGVDNALGPALRSPRIKRGRDDRPGDDAPKPDDKKDKDDDKIVGRRDDDDDADHAADDDDDDDSDSSGASDGSGLGHVQAKAAKAKAKAKGHSKSVGVDKGDKNKRHDSHHSHDSDSSDT